MIAHSIDSSLVTREDHQPLGRRIFSSFSVTALSLAFVLLAGCGGGGGGANASGANGGNGRIILRFSS